MPLSEGYIKSLNTMAGLYSNTMSETMTQVQTQATFNHIEEYNESDWYFPNKG